MHKVDKMTSGLVVLLAVVGLGRTSLFPLVHRKTEGESYCIITDR